ncbi:DUF2726 domain-containing protein [Bremerella alba]|uniref:Topoisomerase DNA binding C4 zinc finger n=1 Tax=Bremerella alba TaxID=980252 RepID=A0A7V8V8M9_9BACT|nr:DUF2726 domain-containing protein [Bremerella alba]MBA2116724.1 hypothetical protein [Bremerella alba]
MTNSEPQGCLLAILQLFGISSGSKSDEHERPYRLRDDFLSAAELSFYRVLQSALGDQATISPKVNLADIFFVARPNENQGYRNKIDRKHVDFLICDPTSMKPLCGIELDDSSHARQDRKTRDEFVDRVFDVAGLPMVRIPANRGYSPQELLRLVGPRLAPVETGGKNTEEIVPAVVPSCPKCDVPMVERKATKGRNAGQTFYGCPNYPRCRQVVNQ